MKVGLGLPAHRVKLQAALVTLIVGFALFQVAALRAQPPYSGWLDGTWQTLAYIAAAVLCLVRIPPSSPDRTAWRIIALGLFSVGLANAYHHWYVPATESALPFLSHVFWLAIYPCAYLGLVLLMRARVPRLSLGLALDGVVVGLGAATLWAATVIPQSMANHRGSAMHPAVSLAYPMADLLLVALTVFALFSVQWRPPTAMWWFAGGLLLYAGLDSLVGATYRRYEPSALFDAGSVIATMLIGLAPGRNRRRGSARPPPGWAPLAVPLLAPCVAISVLAVARYLPLAPAADWLAVATLLAASGRLAVAFLEARHAGEHAHQARTDDLTTLLNRRGFYERASAILSPNAKGRKSCALLLLDLDHFKEVNDSLGHAAGDELLRLVAARLIGSLDENDLLARLGGDEFAILLAGSGIDEAKNTAAALIVALGNGVEIDGVEVYAEASIGIAITSEHGRDLATLLRNADIAMYRAKEARAGFMVFAPELRGHLATREGMEMKAQLRRAIEGAELAVHYQPKILLATGQIIGVEALVRWPHPSLGLLYPDRFLPLARHNSLMHAMTEFVVERALDDASQWRMRGHPVQVAVNLSPPTFADRDLPSRIADAVARHHLTPADLAVEITEDFVYRNLHRARAVLDDLRDLGVTIAIDDFGSGYSALSYLRELPIDEVKLDGTFIAPITTDADAATIVRSVITLSKSLGLTIVAEGVETAETAALLRSYGCDAVEGHFVSPSLSADDLFELLRDEGPQISAATPATAFAFPGSALIRRLQRRRSGRADHGIASE
ncbi:MAG: EAL domain-containing protein [Mycobacterium sp.]